jgi:hypothetical protein
MRIRRLLIPAGVGLFFLASALVALNLTGTQPGTDSPVTGTSRPAANLELTVTLNHGRLISGRPLTVQVELTNTGTEPVALQPDSICTTPLRLELLDASGRVVWSQPVPMIACPQQQPPAYRKLALLNPGETRPAATCFELAGTPDQCVVVDLPSGSYWVAGTYYGFALPQAAFRIVR